MPKTRMTNQRRIILEELRKVHTHPTVDDLYALVKIRMPHISLGTVYRNLDLLAEQGEVLKLESAGSVKRFDGNTAPHRHIRCKICGCIADIPGGTEDCCGLNVEIPGFTVTAIRVEYDGVCKNCEEKQPLEGLHAKLSRPEPETGHLSALPF